MTDEEFISYTMQINPELFVNYVVTLPTQPSYTVEIGRAALAAKEG